MSTLWFKRKIGGLHCRLWTDERLCYQVTKRRRQVTKF